MYDHLYWFLAKVQKDSPASSPKVKISYLSRYYANVDDPDRINIDKSSVVRVSSSDRIVHSLWENKLVRVISDEEHLIPKNYEEFINIKKKTVIENLTDAQSFETIRERVVELADSFINARHYDKGKDVLDFLMTVESALSGSASTSTTSTTATPTTSTAALSSWASSAAVESTTPYSERKRKQEIIPPLTQKPAKKAKVETSSGKDSDKKIQQEGFCFFGVQLL